MSVLSNRQTISETLFPRVWNISCICVMSMSIQRLGAEKDNVCGTSVMWSHDQMRSKRSTKRKKKKGKELYHV